MISRVELGRYWVTRAKDLGPGLQYHLKVKVYLKLTISLHLSESVLQHRRRKRRGGGGGRGAGGQVPNNLRGGGATYPLAPQ